MTETPEVRLKRLRIRAWRRGTKEMDLILGGYADAHLDRMDADETRRFDALLDENDQDLYAWVTGKVTPPDAHQAMIRTIADNLGTK